MQRLLTKSDRENSRNAQFESLIKYGYEKTEYKNLVIFTHPKDLVLKTFWGTSANHTDFYRYKTTEAMNQKVKALKELADYREQWKKEQKEKNKGYKSSHAATAAAIRAELKTKFPGFKFSVTSECFSMGDSVHISWTDGPQCESVNKFVSKYQYGHFNGMEDIYEYTNSREDIPQAKYVQEHRSMSDEAEKIVYDALLNQYGKGYFENLDQWEIKRRIYQKFAETDFCPTIEPTPEKPTTTPEPEAGDKIQIVDYSEKAFAVIGNFSAHYDNLIKLGGAYNSRLKCGRGIIFSKKKLEEVKEYLIAAKGENKEPKQQQPEETQPEEEKPFILHTSPNFETPQTNVFQLEYFKIIWHEGRHIPGATFENTVFNTWEDVQTAFLNLWEVNEKGADGGYTKVKCEMKFTDQEIIINRIDITNRIKNGDFNPSQEHIVAYLQSIAEETEEPQPIEQPQKHKSLPEIRQAATAGKVISLYNLYELVNQ